MEIFCTLLWKEIIHSLCILIIFSTIVERWISWVFIFTSEDKHRLEKVYALYRPRIPFNLEKHLAYEGELSLFLLCYYQFFYFLKCHTATERVFSIVEKQIYDSMPPVKFRGNYQTAGNNPLYMVNSTVKSFNFAIFS